MEKLALRLIRWQTIKKVWQLYSVTHDYTGLLASEMFSDIEAIVCIVKALNSLSGT
jgi:hypothetical protein